MQLNKTCEWCPDHQICKDRNKCFQINRAEQISPERGRTHGNFSENAKFTNAAREHMRLMIGWHALTPGQQLALDEIQLKVARILSSGGDGGKFKEHFDDIAGYANLGGKDCV